MSDSEGRINPISLTLLHQRLESITEEMSVVLKKTAYSPNIKERADFSCAIFNSKGKMLAQAEAIPVHLGSMPFVAKPVIDLFKDWEDGDAIITNSPRAEFGGTHLPDITLLAPIFIDNVLEYVVVNRAHHADVGGSSPGSLPADSTEIFQEGLIIPPVKLYQRGHENTDIMNLILENVRTPIERRGDLRAQYSSLQLGARRVKDLIAKEKSWNFRLMQDELLRRSERGTREILAKIGKGEGTFNDFLDTDGISEKPVRIACTITLDGSGEIDFDFTGSDPEAKGNCNAPLSVTTSACYYLVRLLTGREIPTNSGCYASVKVSAPDGCVVNPTKNAATSSANTETSSRIVDVILGAMSKIIPLPSASQGTMNNLIIGGIHKGQAWTIYETIGGGTGAGKNRNGISAIQSHMTNTQNTPVEALELAYPLRVVEYSIRRGSGGNGESSGGDGIVREIELLDEATITIQSERRIFRPYGQPHNLDSIMGSLGRNLLFRPSLTDLANSIIIDEQQYIPLPSKVIIRNIEAKSKIRIETPGGGGYNS